MRSGGRRSATVLPLPPSACAAPALRALLPDWAGARRFPVCLPSAATGWRPRACRALADCFGIFAAPADLPRRLRFIEHTADLFHEIFGETRLGDEGVAAGSLRALRDPRERVAGQRDHRNPGGPLVGFQPAGRFP